MIGALKNHYSFLLISIGLYAIFHLQMFNPNLVPVGKYTTDALSLHYPSRYYLSEQLRSGRFPFWTEKFYGGFPVYADAERGYLNIPNVILSFVFGPFLSYKLLHFLHYILGSLGLYLFCREKKINIFGFAIFQTIFFFSFYNMVRQQMLNGLMIIYMLPMYVYLLDRIIDTRRIRYILLLSLVFADSLSWGQFNYLSIILILCSVYYLVFGWKKNVIQFAISTGKTLLIFLLLIFIFSSPILLSTGKLFLSGARGQGALDFLEGSYSPIISISSIYPYMLGNSESFVGKIINNEYFLNEIYNYIGISAFILGFFGVLVIKNKRELFFGGITFALVLTLSCIKYFPVLNLMNLPIVNLFRYWGRIYLILPFVVGFFAAQFVSNINERLRLKNFLVYIPALIILTITTLASYKSVEVQRILTHIVNGGIAKDVYFWTWFLVVIGILCVIVLRNRLVQRIVKIILVLIVVIDLWVIGVDVRKDTYAPIRYFDQKVDLTKFKNQRIVHLNDKIFYGSTMMYYPSWGLFGYSAPFEPGDYAEYLKTTGFNSIRRPKIDVTLDNMPGQLVTNMSSLGVHALFLDDGGIVDIKPVNELDLISTPIVNGYYDQKEEGNLVANIESRSSIIIQTTLRNYPGWELKINGNRKSFTSNKSAIFLSFDLPAGTSRVELKYTPIDFYTGIKISLVILALSCISAYIWRKKLLQAL